MLTSAELFKCLEAASISDRTLKAYRSRLKALEALLDKDILAIIHDATNSLKTMRERHENDKTFRNSITAVLALFKYCEELQKAYDKQYKIWRGKHDAAFNEIEEDVINSKMSVRQIAGWVPFSEVRAMVKKLPERSRQRLVVAMYSYIPPVRQDLGAVRIYHETVPEEHEANYLLVTKKPQTMTLHIGAHKTAKKYGAIHQKLPMDLVREISASLKQEPRDWLFANRSGKGYSKDAFGAIVNKIFKDVFGVDLTVQILRHSFASALDYNKLTIADRQAIGAMSGHDYRQQDRYRFIDVPEQLARYNKK